MGKANPGKVSFNAGEWSPRMRGRVDLEKYSKSCQLLENMVPTRQGPVMSRPGFKWIAQTAAGTGTYAALLVPYIIDEAEAYILEFVWDGSTNFDMYVYDQDGTNQAGPITTPFTSVNDLFDGQNRPKVKWAQTSGEMWMAHGDYSPVKIVSASASSWTITQPTFSNGPYFDTDTSGITLTPSALSGTITLTASPGLFLSTDEGRLLRAQDETDGLWRYFSLDTYNSATSMDATLLSATALTDLSALTTFALGLWSDTTGYPSAVTFHEGRLCFNGPEDVPARIDCSVPGLYTNFRPSDTDGTVAADDAIAAVFLTEQSNKIRWMRSMEKGLVAGSSGGNFILRKAATNAALSPLNIEGPQVTRVGNSIVAPVIVDEVALFVQSGQRNLHELVYAYDSDSFMVPDMTILADHIAASRIVQMDYQRSPHSIVWATQQNGELIGMVYDRSQDVVGWYNSPVAGTSCQVKSIAVIPDATEASDQLWACVGRTINGGTKYYLEKMEPFWEDGDSIEDAIYSDGSIAYSGASTSTITGLSHLEGEEVVVWANGARQANQTVSSGQITITTAATKANVGLQYDQKVTTEKFDAGSSDGTAQGKLGRISSVVIRLWQSLGGKVRANGADDWDTIDYANANDSMDETLGVYTGDIELMPIPGIHNRDNILEIVNEDPSPMCIIGLYPTLDKGGR